MKRILALIVALIFILSLAFPAFAYDSEEILANGYGERLSDFSAKLYSLFMDDTKGENYVMSPLSVYFALAMLHYAGDDAVKSEIETFTGMSAEDFGKTADLFDSLNVTYRNYNDGRIESQLMLSNSMWIDESEAEKFDDAALEKMREDLICSIEKAPFFANNKYANSKVRDFVREKTKGLIDMDFGIGSDALFALINTLYFKDIWNSSGSDLRTVMKYFRTEGGVKSGDFLIGYYNAGQIAESECSYYFYANTTHGYKIKFILPKDGYTLSDVMSRENVREVNARSDYGCRGDDEVLHYTRCVFPEFEAESVTNMTGKLKGTGELDRTFNKFDSHLMPDYPDGLKVNEVVHAAKLKVDKKGVEGAAVTVVTVGPGSAAPDPTVIKYHDFVVNKNFGFLVTDRDDVILFEGQINDPFESKDVISESELPAGIEERYDGTFAIDIPNDDAYKADGVGGVRFDLALDFGDDILRMEIASVEGVKEGTARFENGEDGSMTVEITDTERIAGVPSGETLLRVVFTKRPFTHDLYTAKEMLSFFRVSSVKLLPAEKAADAPAPEVKTEQKQLSKQTGDPLILYVIIMASASLLLAGSVLARKKNND